MVQTMFQNKSFVQAPPMVYQKSPQFAMHFPAQSAQPLQPLHQNHRKLPLKTIKPKTTPSHFHPHAITPYSAQSASIQRRNARERNRVKQVNDGFQNLRQHIPHEVIATYAQQDSSTSPCTHPAAASSRPSNRKLSKVDTLKLTVEYIRRLEQILSSADPAQSSSSGEFIDYSSASPTNPPSSSYSEATASPAPSSVSDVSSGPYSDGYYSSNQQHPDLKYESRDPRDEEILDCISWWQQQ